MVNNKYENVMIVGLGSMGRRRIRLLQRFDKNLVLIGVDTNKTRRENVSENFKILTVSSMEKALELASVQYAFVCTSPLTHADIISFCLKNKLHVFSELNLVIDKYDENFSISHDNEKTLFLSSTMLYRAEIMKLREIVGEHKKRINYTYHVGQYLPDWHPWENYMEYFVSDKRSNACREIFAIELPWIIDTFGKITNFYVVKNKISTLKIDYDDNYLLIIEHETGHKGTFTVDVVSRKPVRNLEVFSEDIYLTWNGTPEGLAQYDPVNKTQSTISLYKDVDKLDGYSDFVVENAYLDEIVDFFTQVRQKTIPRYDFEKDKLILQLIDKIEGL